MNKLYLLLFSVYLLFCLDSCKQNNKFELKGELEDLTSDMILVVYDDPEARLDTIYPRDGKFIYTFEPDTLKIFRLVNDSGKSIPFFADKGWTVSLKGDFAHPNIEGDGPNDEYQEFLQSIRTLNDSAQVKRQAETFIQNHPQSYASAYILWQYFIQTSKPDLPRITKLAEPLAGKVKDCRVLSEVLSKLPEKEKSAPTYVNYISAKKRDGAYLSWSGSNQKTYSLLNFWASWSPESLNQKDSLYALSQTSLKNSLRIVNFSLDYQETEWLKNTEKDSEQWIEICDYKGWDNPILKQLQVHDLPFNVLVDQNRKILEFNLHGKELKEKLEALMTAEKKQK